MMIVWFDSAHSINSHVTIVIDINPHSGEMLHSPVRPAHLSVTSCRHHDSPNAICAEPRQVYAENMEDRRQHSGMKVWSSHHLTAA